MAAIQDLQERYYGHLVDRADLFNRLVTSFANKDSVVLHTGCGLDNSIELRTKVQHVIGIDLDARLARNDDVDLPIMGDIQRLPLPDACVDLVINKWVAEHVEDPIQEWAEIARVLRTNGRLILMTPNLMHYAVIATKIAPHKMQKWFMKSILKIDAEDVFPTYLRANTIRKLRWLGAQVDLSEVKLEMFEGAPMYLVFLTKVFLLGVAYERILNRFHTLAWLRSVIIITFRKTD